VIADADSRLTVAYVMNLLAPDVFTTGEEKPVRKQRDRDSIPNE
jgi:hypothetical protein